MFVSPGSRTPGASGGMRVLPFPAPVALWGLPSEMLTSAIKKYMTLLGGEPWDLATEGSRRAAASTQAGRNRRAFEHMHLVLRAGGAQSLGLRMIRMIRMIGRQAAEREFMLSCCSPVVPRSPYLSFFCLPTIQVYPQPVSTGGVMATVQLHFIMSLRLITWPIMFVHNDGLQHKLVVLPAQCKKVLILDSNYS